MLNIIRSIFLVIVLLRTSVSVSQNFATVDAIWKVQGSNQVSAGPGNAVTICLEEYIYIAKDSLVNDKVFQKTKAYEIKLKPNADYLEYEPKESGWIHLMNNQLLYGNTVDSMALLYDFNLETGDTFPTKYLFLGQTFNDTLTVDLVDSILIGDTYRKRWTFSEFKFAACNTRRMVWVQGIGDINLGLLYHQVEFNICPKLTSVKMNGQTLVDNKLEYNPCAGTSKNYSRLMYPNPFSDFISVQYEKTDVPLMLITDSNGKIVAEEYLYYGDNTILLSYLQPGVYFFIVKTDSETTTKKIVKY